MRRWEFDVLDHSKHGKGTGTQIFTGSIGGSQVAKSQRPSPHVLGLVKVVA